MKNFLNSDWLGAVLSKYSAEKRNTVQNKESTVQFFCFFKSAQKFKLRFQFASCEFLISLSKL